MRQFARTQCLHLQRWAVTDVPSNGLQCKEKTFNPLSYCITLQQNAILYQYKIITPSWHKSKEAAENQCRVSSWLLAVWVIESYQIIFENAILILITILMHFYRNCRCSFSCMDIVTGGNVEGSAFFQTQVRLHFGSLLTYLYHKYNHHQLYI